MSKGKREHIRRIKRLNAQHRVLADRKDRLVQQMWDACHHIQAYETEGSTGAPNEIPGGPMRFCPACGYDEALGPNGYQKLRHADPIKVDQNRFHTTMMATLKQLGINL